MDLAGFQRSCSSAAVERIERLAQREHTQCGDGRMVWRCWGTGPPLVLLHGATGSWTHWLLNVLPLAARFRVIVPDMPGFGDSDLPHEPHTAQGLADIVSACLDALVPPPRPLDLAGFSFGGIIGGLVAARQGERVRTLVLVGPNGMALPGGTDRPLARTRPEMTPAEVMATHRENLRILMLADPGKADDLAVHLQMENIRLARIKSGGIPASDTLLRALPAVRARIAGIWGAQDAFALPFLDERRRTLARFQPDLDFRVIERAGHWVAYEAPLQVNAALLEILDVRHRSAPR